MLSACLHASAGYLENRQKKLEILAYKKIYLPQIVVFFFFKDQKQITSDAKHFLI